MLFWEVLSSFAWLVEVGGISIGCCPIQASRDSTKKFWNTIGALNFLQWAHDCFGQLHAECNGVNVVAPKEVLECFLVEMTLWTDQVCVWSFCSRHAPWESSSGSIVGNL